MPQPVAHHNDMGVQMVSAKTAFGVADGVCGKVRDAGPGRADLADPDMRRFHFGAPEYRGNKGRSFGESPPIVLRRRAAFDLVIFDSFEVGRVSKWIDIFMFK
jgi:hypothetical protein